MSREEMINILLEKHMQYLEIPEALEELLLYGWIGLAKYSDAELKNSIDEHNEEEIKAYEE